MAEANGGGSTASEGQPQHSDETEHKEEPSKQNGHSEPVHEEVAHSARRKSKRSKRSSGHKVLAEQCAVQQETIPGAATMCLEDPPANSKPAEEQEQTASL